MVSGGAGRDGGPGRGDGGADARHPAARAVRPGSPRPQDWPALWAKTGELLRRDYDWSAQVAALAKPTLLVFADADSVPTGHVAEFFGLLGGGHRDAGWDGSGRPASRLAVLPGLTHYEMLDSPALPAAVLPFLTAPVRPPQ